MNPIAIIPARGQSKRIPRKNIRNFLGQPILARTINEAFKSEIFSEVYVTTEDREIAAIARSAGAKIIDRNKILSDDVTDTVSVMADAVSRLGIELGKKKEIVCCIYPITPLLQYSRIREAISLLKSSDCNYVLPVLESQQSIDRSFNVGDGGFLENTNQVMIKMRTQDIPRSYFDAGQFYVGYSDSWLEKHPILSSRSISVLLNRFEVVDVDDESDWKFLEELFELRFL